MNIKNTHNLLPLFPLVALSFVLAVNVGNAQTYSADDWYSYNTGTSIDNGATNTATLNYGDTNNNANAAQTYFWSYFADQGSEVALAEGDSLNYSATIEFDFVDSTTNTVSDFRFGIYDSGSRLTTGIVSDRLATGSEVSYREDWTGVFFASGNSNVYRRGTTGITPFTTSGTTSATLTNAPVNQAFTRDVAVALNLNLLRSGDDLLISGNFGADTIGGTYTDYFASAYPATFDTIAVYMGSYGSNQNVYSMTISNATVTVPEVSNFATFMGLSAIGFVCVARSRRG